MSDFKTTWARLKSWSEAATVPVLPPVGALIELAVLVALITLADWLLPNLDVLSLEPNPYWIPVLLLSLQYGTVAGLLAALAATVAYMLNGFPEQSIGENLFAYVLRIWAMPMLWIGVALMLGQFRLRQIAVKQDLKQRLEQRTSEATTLTRYVHDLEARCHILERLATSRIGHAGNGTLEALAQFAQHGADLDSALSRVIDTTLHGAIVSLYAATPAGLERVAGSAWPVDAIWLKDIPVGHALARALLNDKRPVTILTKGDENILLGEGIAAVAVIAPDSGRIVGVLKVESAPMDLIAPTLVPALEVLARLLAPALSEPRIVIDNSLRDGRAALPIAGRLTSGWRQHAWRGASGSDDEAADGVMAASPARLPRSKQSN